MSKNINHDTSPSIPTPTWVRIIDAMIKEDLTYAKELIDTVSDKELHELSIVDDGGTLLHFASRKGYTEIAKSLLNKQPNLIDLVDKDGKTALYHANDKGYKEIASMLAGNDTLIKHTISLIERGHEVIKDQEIKKYVIMVLGPTGVGKGTLINYINGAELIPKYKSGTWKLEAKDPLPGISISHSSTSSDTFHPAIYSPQGGNFSYSYVDTPGFGDSRGVAYDIATAFFRQEITKNVNFIKTLLVLPYEDFVSTVSRGDRIKNQIHTLSQFLKLDENSDHINELKNSIALVVAQVEPPKSSVKELENELEQKRENLRNKLKSKFKNPQEIEETIKELMELEIENVNEKKQEIEKIIPLTRKKTIETSLEQIHTTSLEKDVVAHLTTNNRFEIFSKPIEISQDKAEMVSKEKERILELISDTDYVERSEIEIGLPISIDSKLVVVHLVDYIDEKIAKEVIDSVKFLIRYCKDDITGSHDFDTLKTSLLSEAKILQTIIESRGRESFLENIEGTLNSEEEIKKYVGYIDFFKQLDPRTEYKIDKWCLGLSKSKTIPTNLPTQIESLTKYTTVFKNNILKINGTLVSAKDVLNEIFSYRKDHKEFKEVKICALNKFFLDSDFSDVYEYIPKLLLIKQAYNVATSYICPLSISNLISFYYPVTSALKGINLTIIAPNWKIIGQRTIDLSGKEGISILSKASNGYSYENAEEDDKVNMYGAGKDGTRGTDGVPGNPGTSGGSFKGIGKKFVNLQSLTINVSGGDGGRGQDGGNGGNGTNGNSGNNKLLEEPLQICFQPPRKELGFADKSYGEGAVHAVRKLGTFNSQFLETYTSRGMDGGAGGNAGAGGAGGIGGLPGSAKIITYAENLKKDALNYYCVNQKGEEGESGIAGNIGIGGDNGITYTRQYINEEIFPAFRGRGELSGGGGSITGAISGTAAIQIGVLTPMQIAAQEAAKETVKKATEEAIKKIFQQSLYEGSIIFSNTVAKEILTEVGKQVGKEVMQAVGKEAAHEIGLQAVQLVAKELAMDQVLLQGVTHVWVHSDLFAQQVGTGITTGVAKETAVSWLTTARGFATSLGISMAIQGGLSVVSAYSSSGWNREVSEINSGKAESGTKPIEENTVNQNLPKKSVISDQTAFKAECELYYKEFSDTAPNFVDPDFTNLCMLLTGTDTGLQVDHA